MNTSAFNGKQAYHGISHAYAENEQRSRLPEESRNGNHVMDRFVCMQTTTGSSSGSSPPSNTLRNGTDNKSILRTMQAPSMRAMAGAASSLALMQAIESSPRDHSSYNDSNKDALGIQDHAVPRKPSGIPGIVDGDEIAIASHTYLLKRQSRHAPRNSAPLAMGGQGQPNPKEGLTSSASIGAKSSPPSVDVRVVSETASSRRSRSFESTNTSTSLPPCSTLGGLNLISNLAAQQQLDQRFLSQRYPVAQSHAGLFAGANANVPSGATATESQLLRMQRNHAGNRHFLQAGDQDNRTSAASAPTSQFASMLRLEQERQHQLLESSLHASSTSSNAIGNFDTVSMDNYYTRMLIEQKKRRIELEENLILESIMRKRQRLDPSFSLPAAADTRRVSIDHSSAATSSFTSGAAASSAAATDHYSFMLLQRKRMQDEQAAALAAASARQERLMIEAQINKLDTIQSQLEANRNGATTYPSLPLNNNRGLDALRGGIQATTRNSNLIPASLNLYEKKAAVANPTDYEGRCHEVRKDERELEFVVSRKKSKSKSNRDMNNHIELITPNKEHFSKRPYMHLGTDTDDIWLSKFLTFLRSECIEVFTASQSDVYERKTSKKILVNQVGLRCRFCAHLPYRARVVRSSCFPSSICRIYQSLTMMIREHFSRCPEMPEETRRKYTELKWMTKKGEIESKSHWIESAKSVGMVESEKGIFLNKPLTLTYPDAFSPSKVSDDSGEDEKDAKSEEESVAVDGMAI